MTPPDGWLNESIDNGLLKRDEYPELWEVAKNSMNIASEADWQGNINAHEYCGHFSVGDGSTTFRIPLIRKAFMRAIEPGITSLGQGQGNAIRDITGELGIFLRASMVSGAFFDNRPGTNGFNVGASVYANSITAVGFNASKVVPTAEENRPKSIIRIPIMKVKHIFL